MVNKVILVGRLGKDPEVRASSAGKQFCNMTLATDSGFGDNKKTDWHNIVVFDKQAENCGRYLKKGSLIYVEGRISYDKYNDKDGQVRYTTRIIANSIQFLDTKNSNGGNYDQSYDQRSNYEPRPSYEQRPSYNNAPAPAPAPQGESFAGDAGFSDEEIPF